MLTDEEKNGILEQEAFRKEIREELSPSAPKTTKTRIWEVLNSNFGMWLLSAVVLSGIVTAYTKHQTQAEAEQKKREADAAEVRRIAELRDRLRLELSFRVSSVLTRLDELQRASGASQDSTTENKKIQMAFAALALPATDALPPLLPEYKSYSGVALIAELRRHTGPGERMALKSVLTKTAGFLNELYSANPVAKRSTRETAIGLLQRTREVVGDSGFPFVDCSDEKPFC